jgi:hypothetical protein
MKATIIATIPTKRHGLYCFAKYTETTSLGAQYAFFKKSLYAPAFPAE